MLSSNYIDFLDSGFQEKIEILVKKISDEQKTGNTLKKQIKDHERILSDLIETKSVTSNTNYLDTHIKFEQKIENYFSKYQDLKKQIFEVVERIMRKKEQKKLL